jgi:hypothetical protein
MVIKQFFPVIVTITAVGTTAILGQSTQAQSDKFICSVDKNNIPTTYANTPDGPKPVIRWQSNFFPPPYTPMRRCQEITGRFNKFYNQGILDYMATGTVENSPVICAGMNCSKETVLITLKSDQKPAQALQEMLANRGGASGPTYQGSGSNSMTISLESYLELTPVEEVGSSVNVAPNPVPSNSVQNTTTSPNSIY